MFLLLISCPSYFVVSNVLPNLTNVLFSSVIQFIFLSLCFFFLSTTLCFLFLCSLFRSVLTVCCLGMLMRFLGFYMLHYHVVDCLCFVKEPDLFFFFFSYYNLHDKYYCSVTENKIKYIFLVLSLRFPGK